MASEVAVDALLHAGDVPVHVSGWADAAQPEFYEWTLLGERRSYRFSGWGELSVSDGGWWTPVALSGPRGSEASRLSLFAAAVRGVPSANLADFATAFRVQEVIESFHAKRDSGSDAGPGTDSEPLSP
ncbi:MAG: hypothetical protein DLM58_13885 [Pseudonocardiales bacterium]|nr:MAG: hypothetical protein DLM58_13885 [Pseudonocardiales bacterium]